MLEKITNIKFTLDKCRKEAAKHFYTDKEGVEIIVNPEVFSPMYFEDSRFFAENMIDIKGLKLLEIGTGTGYFAIKMVFAGASHVTATDVSVSAFENANLNIQSLGLEQKINVLLGSIFLPVEGEKFDIIFWNIPFCFVDDSIKEKLGLNSAFDELDNTVFNYKYELLKTYLKRGFSFLSKKGRLLLGFSPTIGSENNFDEVVSGLKLVSKVLVEKDVLMDGNVEKIQIIEFFEQ